MALLVLAYPDIKKSDYQRIQEFRKEHDFNCDLLEPHFTLVFPVDRGWESGSFITEISKQVQGVQAIKFCLRCAVLNKDVFSEYYFTLLVPDEGHSKIVKLHDKLYADKLFPHRSLLANFTPHITVGNSKDSLKCLEMIESWNKKEFAIEGCIAVLDVAKYENDAVQTIKRIPLAV
ncbi:MAG TPA: 2'-5' RNA ligase family protein [Terriglobales bacterium]|nr:2'-5' RNA ligase family protein [Terriglobales bacterium]